jgi:hypothetical protein
MGRMEKFSEFVAENGMEEYFWGIPTLMMDIFRKKGEMFYPTLPPPRHVYFYKSEYNAHLKNVSLFFYDIFYKRNTNVKKVYYENRGRCR